MYSAVNTDWNPYAPAYAGVADAGLHGIPDELGYKAFHVFVKRAVGEFEYVGSYRKVRNGVITLLDPATISDDSKREVVRSMLNSPGGCANLLDKWASVFGLNPNQSNLRKIAERAVERREFWTVVPVKFVKYDEELYRLLLEKKRALEAQEVARTEAAKRLREEEANAGTDDKRARRAAPSTPARDYAVGDSVTVKWSGGTLYPATVTKTAAENRGKCEVKFTEEPNTPLSDVAPHRLLLRVAV